MNKRCPHSISFFVEFYEIHSYQETDFLATPTPADAPASARHNPDSRDERKIIRQNPSENAYNTFRFTLIQILAIRL